MYHYQNARRHISKPHGGNHPEDGSKNLFESRSFLIMWAKPDPLKDNNGPVTSALTAETAEVNSIINING